MGRLSSRSVPKWLALAVAVVVCAMACAAVSSGIGRATSTRRFTCDYTVAYASLAGLRHDAAAVVEIKPTGASRIVHIASVPFTISTVEVLNQLAGKHLRAIIGLRQLGERGVDGCGAAVSRTDVYIAYLVPFKLRPKGPDVSGQYVVVGANQGLFAHPGSRPPTSVGAKAFTRVASQASALPERISVSDAKAS